MRVRAIHDLSLSFFTALGVVLGGAVIGSIASVIHLESPIQSMIVIARQIKLWAVVVSIGGTLPTIRAIESSVGTGEIHLLLQQLAVIMSGFIGASVGYWVIVIIGGKE